jgi:hypothetical protein
MPPRPDEGLRGMSFGTEPGPPAHSGQTDFGREMMGAGSLSLAEALRDRAWRTARAEAYRFQVAMGLVGFVSGLAIFVPAALWLASVHNAGTGTLARRTPIPVIRAIEATASETPALVSVPALAPREPVAARPLQAHAAPNAEQQRAIEEARDLIRAGQLQSARALLIDPRVADIGEAAFMLAETFDPNVLAALGITNVQADADAARHHYGAALAKGITAAAQRLEALQ